MKSLLLFALVALSLLAASVAVAMPDMKPESTQAETKPPIAGKVLEVINSGGYTYLLLDIDGFKDWVAIPELYVEVGEDVELQTGVQMGEFKSKPLNRTFKQILFSAGPTPAYNEKRKVNAHKGADMSAPAPGKKKAEGKIVEGLKVEKASTANAYSIEELFVQRDGLQDKIVVVRGQVVKVSVGIMGRNWIHIKDGSGKAADNKLVVTTKDEPNLGDIVTATGVFRNNVDFGGGYQYAVIMEDATVK